MTEKISFNSDDTEAFIINILQNIMVMGGNDQEKFEINKILDAYRKHEIDSVIAKQQAINIRDSKNSGGAGDAPNLD